MAGTTAVRGHAISFKADPFFVNDALLEIDPSAATTEAPAPA
jgi:hypothetical protein